MLWERTDTPASPPSSPRYIRGKNDESPSASRASRIRRHSSQRRLPKRSQSQSGQALSMGSDSPSLDRGHSASPTRAVKITPKDALSSRTSGFSPSTNTVDAKLYSRRNTPNGQDSKPSPRRLLWGRSTLKSSNDELTERPANNHTKSSSEKSGNGSSLPGSKSVSVPGLAKTPIFRPDLGADSRLHDPSRGSGYWEDIDVDKINEASRGRRRRESPQTPNYSRPYSFRGSLGNEGRPYPEVPEPEDPARKLGPWELRCQRFLFYIFVLSVNGACLAAALASHRHLWVLVLIVYIKSRDLLSTIAQVICLSFQAVYALFHPPAKVPSKWILSLITAYSETEEQIIKTLDSVRNHSVLPHKQVICIILDGKPKNVQAQFTQVVKSFHRPYVTWKSARNELTITAGFMADTPAIVIEKDDNAGKKDSLVLCHDLFNALRDNAPVYTKLLRHELATTVLPILTGTQDFKSFDMIFATDADSIIHEGAIASLADALGRKKNAIAACGLVLAEMKPGAEWSTWYLYQQFEYTFGQYVRRRAEGLWGKVTCLPGCVTMIVVRPEMAGAICRYTEPVKDLMVLRHQVQYLGTDRRLTYCMLSQDKKLRTLFVPHAVSETVAPQTLRHYLSQRRRWASNAYFNNYFYCFGGNQAWITRLWASIDLIRLTLVYYRVANTILFIHGLARNFYIIKLIPFIVVTQTPTCWYLLFLVFREPILRRRAHKLFFGFAINKVVSSILSIIIFTTVVFNLGNQAWGRTGISTRRVIPLSPMTLHRSWSPGRLGRLVRDVVKRRPKATAALTKREAAEEKAAEEPATGSVMERSDQSGVQDNRKMSIRETEDGTERVESEKGSVVGRDDEASDKQPEHPVSQVGSISIVSQEGEDEKSTKSEP